MARNSRPAPGLKRGLALYFLAAAGIAGTDSAPGRTLTAVRAIRSLKSEEAGKRIPVHLTGVVTALSGWKNSFFLQDGTGGISIDRSDITPELSPGERVEVTGVTSPGMFAPIVLANRVRISGSGALPPARTFEFGQLSGGQQDSQRIAVRGVVHSAEEKTVWGRRVLLLRIETGAGEVAAHVLNFQPHFAQLVDAEILVRGVCGTNFNAAGQFVGVRLFVPGANDILIEKPASRETSSLPLRSIETLLTYGQDEIRNHRIRVRGVVTYRRSGKDIYIQNQGHALEIRSEQETTVSVGEGIEASGFAVPGDLSPVLDHAICKALGKGYAPVPQPVQADRMILQKDGFPAVPYEGVLVTLEAELLESTHTRSGQLLLLRQGETVFESRLESPFDSQLPVLAPGSILSLTGISVADADKSREPKNFQILLRSAADVRVARRASWWDAQHTAWILAFTGMLALATLAGLLALRQRIREQGSEIAKRHEHSRLILESANDAFVETDFEGRILEWNKRAEQLFGWSRSEALRKNLTQTIIPERFRAAHLQVMASSQETRRRRGGVRPLELTAIHRNGDEFPVDFAIWTVNGSDGVKFSAFIRDISQRKQAEQQLRLSEQFNRHILDSSPDSIKVLDISGNVLSMNAGGCRAWEIEDLDTVISHRWPELWPGEARAGAETALSHAQRGGEGAFQGFYPTAKGTPKWWDVRVTAIADMDGLPRRLLVVSRDITEQKASEQALKTSESNLKETQALAHLGHWDFDLITRKVTWSEETYRIFGLPVGSEVNHDSYLNLLTMEDRERGLAKVEKALSSSEPYDLTHPIHLADGSVKYIETRGRAERGPDGVPIRLTGSALDVTLRVEAALELRRSHEDLERRVELRTTELARSTVALQQSMQAVQRSEAEFRQLADSMPQIVWTADAIGVVDYYNERWFEFTGFDRDLSGDQSWTPLLHPDDVQRCLEGWRESVVTGTAYKIECRLWDRVSSTYRWHLARALPSRNADGQVAKWFGTSSDIEDYKRAETEILALNRDLEIRVAERTAELSETNQELRRTQSWLRAVLDSATQASVVAIDNDGIITLFNSGAEKLLGYAADELVGKRTPRILHSAEYCATRELRLTTELQISDAAENLFAGKCQPDSSVVMETIYIHRDGTPIDVSLATTPMIASTGERLGSLGIAVDIRPRKILERKLNHNNVELQEQTRRAEEANLAKSDFLAGMSHEIRTPMNAILGMADLLWESDLQATQRQYVQVFRRAGAQLLTLVDDILDVSKIESGHFELEQVDFDLQEVVDRAVQMIRPKTDAKRIGLYVRIDPGIPSAMVGDPTRLQQILVNLLGNAVKFTAQGEISLTVTPVLSQKGRIRFEVTDTGIGISSDKLQSIFDDFTQAETSTTRRFGGTGLGLGICRRLVYHMGGNLDVLSELGHGSSFYFDAVFGESVETRQHRAEPLLDLAGRRVLIVDNNATNRLIFTEMCTGWGMAASECASAEPALSVLGTAVATGRPFHLVILDRLMPGLDGFELVSRVREIDQGVPIVLVTSDKVPGDETRSKQMGLAGYTVKPVERAELLRIIRCALGGIESEIDGGGEQPALSSSDESAHPGRILIAEDSEDNRFLLQAYLANSPYELTFAENGRIAVAAAGAQSFDLILMDMQMPLMDGLTATKLIRQAETTRAQSPIPILALTANARAEDIQASRTAGCNSHLSKPISKANLLNAIREYVRPAGAPPEPLAIHIPAGLEEAAKRYIESRKKEVPRLFSLVRDQEFDRVGELAHNIKGTGTSFGFPDLTRLGGLMEASAADRNTAMLSEQLIELSRYVGHAEELVGLPV